MARTAEELLEQYRIVHAKRDTMSFNGHTLRNYEEYVVGTVNKTEAESVIDWGSGRASGWTNEFLARMPKLLDVCMYDPAVEEYKELPEKPADVVVCTDVLEHILPEDLKKNIEIIFSYAKKACFFGIPCYPARFPLPDGTNPHVSILLPHSWQVLLADEADRTGKLVTACFRLYWVKQFPGHGGLVRCKPLPWYWEPGKGNMRDVTW